MWAAFLEREMAKITHLNVKIMNGHGSPALAHALMNPQAPRLRYLKLDLEAGVNDITDLFNLHAPLLKTAIILTCTPYDLHSFPSIRQLLQKVNDRNFRRLPDMLRETPRLQILTLVGTRNRNRLPRDPAAPVVLEACTALDIEYMEADKAYYIMFNIQTPNLKSLAVRELTMKNDDGSFCTSIDPALALLPPPLTPRHALLIRFSPTSLEIATNNGFRFRTDWSDIVAQKGSSVSNVVLSSIIALVTQISLQPSLLFVDNNVSARRAPRQHPLHLVREDIHQLLHLIFPVLPSVQNLFISDNFSGCLGVLHSQASYLPLLESIGTTLRVGEVTVPEDVHQAFVVAAQKRLLEVLHHEPLKETMMW